MKFSGKVGNVTVNKWINFGRDVDHRLDIGIVFRILHYWEIWKVVSGHKSVAHADSPYMAALVRRALAQVCTVSALLVSYATKSFM